MVHPRVQLAVFIGRAAFYKYTDRAQLVSLLAHELGHALGLDHVTDPESLMHPVNKGGSLKLTEQDIAELNRVCR